MRDPANIDELITMQPDYIGFIFYPPSKRYVRDIAVGEALNFIPGNIKRTGVFVNASKEEIEKARDEYKLNALQLHGNETPDFCRDMQKTDLEIIKAFHVDEYFDFATLEPFLNCCDYFLFDTKTDGYGGSGKKFGWEVLEQNPFDKPFFLSGGIGPNDVNDIFKINHNSLYAVDINSKFETEPGMKDLKMLKRFINELRNNE